MAARSVIALALAAAPALAQIPEATEGRGIKVGEGLVLHPGLMVDTTYDSNLHYSAGSGDPDGPVRDSPYLRVTGHLDLASLPPQRLGDGQPAVDFRLGSAVSYREYFNDDPDVKELRGLDLEGALQATFNPQGLASFRVFDQFARLRDVRNSDGPFTITRDRNRVGAELGVRPGGGTIVATLGYEFDVEFFEEDLRDQRVCPNGEPEQTGNPDSSWHVLTGTGRWRFLPKTAATVDVAYSLYDKDNDVLFDCFSDEIGPAYYDSTALRATGGVIGLLTPKLTTTLRAGYGRADYDGDDDFGGIIGKAIFDWSASVRTRLKVGYERDFQDSVAANFYIDDRLFAALEQSIDDRWRLTLEPAVRFRHYRSYREQYDPQDQEPGTSRDDTLGDLRVALTFHVFPWLLAGGAYSIETNSSAWRGGEGEYVKHVVLLRVEGAF